MPTLAGWLTGEQVQPEIIEQTLTTMGEVLSRYGGEPARTVQPGSGLLVFADKAYAQQQNDEPPVLDWVPDRRTLVYRRPLSGLHALYFIEDWPAAGNLLFASEIKALLSVGVPRRLHIPALNALAHYGFIPAPWTIFKDIQIVPAGSILRWQRAKTVLNHATDYDFAALPDSPYSLDDLSTLLDQTTANQLPPHEQMVALSGGDIPSTIATFLTTHHTQNYFPIASYGYTKPKRTHIWDHAQQIANACGQPLLTITGVDQPAFWTATIAGLEAPCMDSRPLALHQLLHTVSAETGARIALTGVGGDILTTPLPAKTGIEQVNTLSGYRSTQIEPAKKNIWSAEITQLLDTAEPWEETLHARKLARRATQFASPAQGWYYLHLHLSLPDSVVNTFQQIALQERMALRSPYLNAQVLDLLACLPEVFPDGTRKENCLALLLQQLIPDINFSFTPLPLATPVTSLLNITDSDLLQQTLSPAALKTAGIFDPQTVALLRKEAVGKVFPRELLLIFTTQLLYQLFSIDGWQ